MSFSFNILFVSFFLIAFTLSACHLLGTVSTWALHQPCSRTLAREARQPPQSLALHHLDSCNCCKSTASQPPVIPTTTCTTAALENLHFLQYQTKEETFSHTKKDEGTFLAGTWWRSFRVLGCTEWQPGGWGAPVTKTGKQSDLLRKCDAFTSTLLSHSP